MSATTAEAPEPETAEEGAAGTPEKKKGKLPSKKMMLMIGGPVALLIIGLAAAFFLGIFGGGSKEAEQAHHEAKAAPKPLPQFYELPDLLVNLNSSGGKRQSFLKLSVSLEVATPEDATRLKAMQPRIMLFDEPTSALDPVLEQQLMDQVRFS